VRGLAADAESNLYLAGAFGTSLDLGGQTWAMPTVLGHTATGALRWVRSCGVQLYGVAHDGAGNLSVIGTGVSGNDCGGGPLSPSAPAATFLVASYTTAGAHRWSKLFETAYLAQPDAVAADRAGNVIVVGYRELRIDFGDGNATCGDSSRGATIASFSSAGALRWSRCLSAPLGATDRYSRALGVTADAAGNVYVAGVFGAPADLGGGTVTPQGRDGFIASYTQSGAYRWAKRMGGTGTDWASAVAVDAGGNVIVTGSFTGTADLGGAMHVSDGAMTDGFVASFDGNGSHRWSYRIGGTGSAVARGVATTASDVYVTGDFAGAVDFGDGPSASRGGNDIFVVSLTAGGTRRWSGTLGGRATEFGDGLLVTPSGRIFVYGGFSESVDFTGTVGVVASQGQWDAFVLEITP
jgi:hypothetical protein